MIEGNVYDNSNFAAKKSPLPIEVSDSRRVSNRREKGRWDRPSGSNRSQQQEKKKKLSERVMSPGGKEQEPDCSISAQRVLLIPTLPRKRDSSTGVSAEGSKEHQQES